MARAVALAGAVAVALLPLITWSWEDLGPGAEAAGWWVRAAAGAARLRALLPAPRGTRAGAAMAPGFGIAFLGVALGPLGSAQEKLHNVIVAKRPYLDFIPNTLKSSSNVINATFEAQAYSQGLRLQGGNSTIHTRYNRNLLGAPMNQP